MKPTFDIPVVPISLENDDKVQYLPSTLRVIPYHGSLSERVQRDVALLRGGRLCDIYNSDGYPKEQIQTIPLRRVPVGIKILVPPMEATSLQWCAPIGSKLHIEFSSFPKSYDGESISHTYLTTLCGIFCAVVPTKDIQLSIPTCPKCLESKVWMSVVVLPYLPPEVIGRKDRKVQQERRARSRLPSRYDLALTGPQPKTSILPTYQELDPEDLYVGRELKLQSRKRQI